MLATLNAAPEQIAVTGNGYAVAYPFGIIGVLLRMGLLRMIFRVNVPAEAAQYASAIAAKHLPIERMSIEIRSPAAAGVPLMRLPSLLPNLHEVYPGVIVSRVMHAGKQHVAQPSDVLQVGDVVTCAATRPQLEKLRDLVGVESSVRLDEIDSPVVARDMPVTRPRVFGKHIADLHIHHLYGMTIARLNRAGIDLASAPGVKLRFGDHITCVGEDRLRQVGAIVGNQSSALQHSQIIPIFVGIALGVLLGSIPVFIPGVPAPLSLGLAGGPVVVAIVLTRIGAIGPLHWNMPPDTIDTVRELSVSLFMTSVGIYAGKSLVATMLNGDGLLWLGCAALITFIPICLVGLVARGIVKVNCLSLCGVLAGSGTAAGPGLRQRAQSVAGAIHRICGRLPADHVPAHRVAANHPRFSLACLLNCITEIGFQVRSKNKQKRSNANELLVKFFGITIGHLDWPSLIPKPNRS